MGCPDASERPKNWRPRRTLLETGFDEAVATSAGDIGSRQASRAKGCARRDDEDLEVNLAGIVRSSVLMDGRNGDDSHHPPR